MGLKGPNNLAQGNALGKRAKQPPEPLRGATGKSWPMSMSAFQALDTLGGIPYPGRNSGLQYPRAYSAKISHLGFPRKRESRGSFATRCILAPAVMTDSLSLHRFAVHLDPIES